MLAKEFAVRLHVQSQQQGNGDLVIRGVDENGETRFQFEIHVQHSAHEMNSSYRSILENSLEEYTEGVQVWKDLGDAEAETL